METNNSKNQNNAKGKKRKGNRQVTLCSLPLAERVKKFSTIVKQSFERLVKDNGEENVIAIWAYLMSDEFIMRFISDGHKNNKKIIKDTKEAININVKNIIMEYIDKHIDDLVNEGLSEGLSRKDMVYKIQNSVFAKSTFGKEKITDPLEMTISRHLKKNIERQLELIEQEKEIDRKKDIEFIKTVSEYTNNYSFLAIPQFIYISENGYFNQDERKRKFKNTKDYFRFLNIQSKVQERTEYCNGDEKRAIQDLLNNGQDEVVSTILKNRLDRINKTLNLESPESDDIEL